MNSVMKSFMIVVVIFLGLVHAQAAEALMTREQAVAMLIQQVIEPSQNKDELMAFGPQNMLNAGDRVEPADLEYDTHPENAQTIQGPTWFFWVDSLPDTIWFDGKLRFFFLLTGQPVLFFGTFGFKSVSVYCQNCNEWRLT